MKTHGIVAYTDVNYLRSRVCTMTVEDIVTKAFKVKNWMNMNPDNEWVQQAGKSIINKLNAITTIEQSIIR